MEKAAVIVVLAAIVLEVVVVAQQRAAARAHPPPPGQAHGDRRGLGVGRGEAGVDEACSVGVGGMGRGGGGWWKGGFGWDGGGGFEGEEVLAVAAEGEV